MLKPDTALRRHLRLAALGAVAGLALLVLAGCSPSSDRSGRAPLTERQRDSVLAKSVLPGAPVVGRALDVSDQATGRSAELAASDSLFR